MSVQSQINRIAGNISSAYTAISGKGGTVPSSQTSANLATAISSIPTGGGSLSVLKTGSATPSSRVITVTGVSSAPKVVVLYFVGKKDVGNLKPMMASITLNNSQGVIQSAAMTASVGITDTVTVTTSTSVFSVSYSGTTVTITCNTSSWFSGVSYNYMIMG